MSEYNRLALMLCVIIVLVIAIFSISYMLKARNYNWEKISAYECGFQAFEDARSRFDVKYYLVGILFIIFDVEIIFLFPWSLYIDGLFLEGVVSMIIFLYVLIVGFIYEWRKGALDWY